MKHRAFFLCLTAGLLWGTTGIFSSLLTPYGLSSLSLTAARGIGSAVFISLYVFLFRRACFRITLRQGVLFGVGGLLIFATALLFYEAIGEVGVPTASVLMYTAPAFVMAYSVSVYRERLTRRKLLALCMILLGCLLVSGVLFAARFSLRGVMLGLGSGVTYAVYNIVAKEETGRGYHSLSASLYHFLTMGAVCLFIFSPSAVAASMKASPFWILFLLLILGLVSCVLPYLMFSLSLKHLPVGTASALSVVEPMAATLYSVIFFKEAPTASAAVGIVLILSACILFGTEKKA